MDDPLLPAKRKRDQLDAPSGMKEEEGARAARASAGEQLGVSGGGSPEAVTVALLSGHDDPCTNEQYTMWKERLFTDVWLQARHTQGNVSSAPTGRAALCLSWPLCRHPLYLTRLLLCLAAVSPIFRRVTRASRRARGCLAHACSWPASRRTSRSCSSAPSSCGAWTGTPSLWTCLAGSTPWRWWWRRVCGWRARGGVWHPSGLVCLARLTRSCCLTQALYSRRLRMSVGAGPYCVLDVLRVANFLDVRCVLDVALAFLQANLSTSNALRVASLGEAHGLADVRAAAVEFVVNNFEAMVGSGGDCAGSSSAMVDTGFVAIDKALLVELLQSDRLRVNGEMTVFRALMAWLDANDDLMAPPLTTEQPGQGITATGQSLPLDDDAPHDGHDAAGCNSAPQPGRPCPHHLLSLIRFQYIPQEFLFGEVAPHPRLQTLGAKDMLLSTLREFNVSNTLAAVPPAAPPSPATAATADPLPPSAEPGMLLSIKAYPPRQYDKVDSRTVPMGTQLRVRDCEELVRGLCDTLPVDQPIKFVMRMKQTIGQQGRLMQKSRRGSLKLHFDLPELPDERRDFWYPAEALSYV